MRTAAWAVLVLAGGAVPAEAADVAVTVDGLRSDSGHVRVAVCTADTFLTRRCAYHGSAPAKAGPVTVTVTGVPPGKYAAQAYHDENGNDTLDQGLFGIPLEGLGFSNNAPINFAPPDYKVAEFTVAEPRTATALKLRYMVGN